MAKGKSQFVGAAGQFYLSYSLAIREIHASLTLGNAPSVDVLASSADGKRTLSFQVKTARNAHRRNRYQHEGYEWYVGASAVGNHHPSFWYAFVDMQEQGQEWNPKVFFVPSLWVSNFVKPDWPMFLYFLPQTARDLTYENWTVVKDYLAGDQSATDWANSWPEEKLVKWGAPPETISQDHA